MSNLISDVRIEKAPSDLGDKVRALARVQFNLVGGIPLALGGWQIVEAAFGLGVFPPQGVFFRSEHMKEISAAVLAAYQAHLDATNRRPAAFSRAAIAGGLNARGIPVNFR